MNLKEMKELFDLTAKKVAKIDEETALIRKQAEKHREETEKAFRRLSDRTDTTAAELGFYTKKVAEVAEDYFYKSLKNNPVVNGMKFDKVSANERIQGYEYDIVLSNRTTIMVISVKTNLSIKHISELVRKELPRFRTSYNNAFQHYKLYGAIASLTGNENQKVLDKAEEVGILILGQTEDKQASVLNPNVSLKSF